MRLHEIVEAEVIDLKQRFADKRAGLQTKRKVMHRPREGEQISWAAVGADMRLKLKTPSFLGGIDDEQPYAARGLWAVVTDEGKDRFVYYAEGIGWYFEAPEHIIGKDVDNVTTFKKPT